MAPHDVLGRGGVGAGRHPQHGGLDLRDAVQRRPLHRPRQDLDHPVHLLGEPGVAAHRQQGLGELDRRPHSNEHGRCGNRPHPRSSATGCWRGVVPRPRLRCRRRRPGRAGGRGPGPSARSCPPSPRRPRWPGRTRDSSSGSRAGHRSPRRRRSSEAARTRPTSAGRPTTNRIHERGAGLHRRPGGRVRLRPRRPSSRAGRAVSPCSAHRAPERGTYSSGVSVTIARSGAHPQPRRAIRSRSMRRSRATMPRLPHGPRRRRSPTTTRVKSGRVKSSRSMGATGSPRVGIAPVRQTSPWGTSPCRLATTRRPVRSVAGGRHPPPRSASTAQRAAIVVVLPAHPQVERRRFEPRGARGTPRTGPPPRRASPPRTGGRAPFHRSQCSVRLRQSPSMAVPGHWPLHMRKNRHPAQPPCSWGVWYEREVALEALAVAAFTKSIPSLLVRPQLLDWPMTLDRPAPRSWCRDRRRSTRRSSGRRCRGGGCGRRRTRRSAGVVRSASSAAKLRNARGSRRW